MAGFHLNFSMVAFYETKLSLVTFEFCDGGVIQRIFFIVTMYEKRLSLVLGVYFLLVTMPVATSVLSRNKCCLGIFKLLPKSYLCPWNPLAQSFSVSTQNNSCPSSI